MHVTLKAGVTCPLHPSSLILMPTLIGKHTIHGHFINLCAVVLLNITQDSNVIWFHKVDGNTFAAKPTWTTNPKIEFQAITGVKCTKQLYICILQQLTESCISKTTHQLSNMIKTLKVRLNRPFPSWFSPHFKTILCANLSIWDCTSPTSSLSCKSFPYMCERFCMRITSKQRHKKWPIK